MDIAKAALNAAKAAQLLKDDLQDAYEETLLDIGKSLIHFTPLLTGLSSSNWNLGVKTSEWSERGVQHGTKGQAAITAMTQQVKELHNNTKTVVFKNPVDYIEDLERGSSPKAPAGMITPTKMRVEGLWLKNLKKRKLAK